MKNCLAGISLGAEMIDNIFTAYSRAEDKVKLSDDVIANEFISTPESRILHLSL
jgi:hypothetical protein